MGASCEIYRNILVCSIQVVAEVAAPLSQTKRVVMVSSGDGQVGAAKLTNEVVDIVNQLPKVVESMTGMNIEKVEFRI